MDNVFWNAKPGKGGKFTREMFLKAISEYENQGVPEEPNAIYPSPEAMIQALNGGEMVLMSYRDFQRALLVLDVEERRN
jgi:hypothetical protein